MTIKDLRDLRLQLKISQKEAGKSLNYSTETINAIETGRYKPNVNVNFLLAYENFLTDVMNGKRDAPRKRYRSMENPVSREKVAELRTLRKKLKIKLKDAALHINKHAMTLSGKELGCCNMSQEEYDTLMKFYKSVKNAADFGANYKGKNHGVN